MSDATAVDQFVEDVSRELEKEGRNVLTHPSMRALAEGRLPLEGFGPRLACHE